MNPQRALDIERIPPVDRKRILITGASGTVGFEVLKQLVEKTDQYDITVFDVPTRKAKKVFKPYRKKIRIVFGSIVNERDVQAVTAGKDAVIHLAALIPPNADARPQLAYQVNAVGTANLITALEKNSPNSFFIYSSSISVYGDRIESPFITVADRIAPSEGDEYAKTKIMAEDIIKRSKLSWTIFRLTAIMGGHKISRLMFHQPLATCMEIATPRDAARAFVNAIGNRQKLSGTIYNLGGGANCRILYEDFLSRSFTVYGLGKMHFKPMTFAEKNFHCGYYADGDALNEILNFQEDSIEDYFEHERRKTHPIVRLALSICRLPIQAFLQKISEPFLAFHAQDKNRMRRYFKL